MIKGLEHSEQIEGVIQIYLTICVEDKHVFVIYSNIASTVMNICYLFHNLEK